MPAHSLHKTNLLKAVSLLVITILALVACSQPRETAPIAELTPTTQAITSTPISEPQPSPTTSTSSKVVLISLPGSNQDEVVSLEALVSELSNDLGLQFETWTELTEVEINPSISLVIAIPPDPGLQNLAVANPITQFLAVGIPEIQADNNLSAIGSSGTRPDQQGFIAGNLAAVITQDWRVGVVVPAGSKDGRTAYLGFNNGVIFFCGLCRPAFPPFIQYPQFIEVQPDASQEDLQAVVTALQNNAVKTVYVYPFSGQISLLELLAQAGINVIGSSQPQPSYQQQWIAAIELNLLNAVRDVIPRLLNGEQAIEMQVPIVISNQNQSLFSPGRQRVVDKTLADLLAGFIDTGVDPETGEPR